VELENLLKDKARQKLNKELNNYTTWVKAIWLNSRGEPLDFEEHKLLIDIYLDQYPDIVYQKSAQHGLSERLISEAVWICDRLKKNVLYVFPTSSQLNDFVQARLEPVFSFSEYLSRITGVLTMAQKKQKNIEEDVKIRKVGLKQIGDAFLYLRGSQNQQQIISVDADCIILDERDRFMQEHVPYIDKRLLHSTMKWRREASTPTYPGIGISEAYNNSDQRIWMLKCDHCKHEQELNFFYNIDYDTKTTVCKACKKPINRLKMGRWVAQKPENKAIHGYKVNGIYNPRHSVAEMIKQYEDAKIKGFSAMQQFYNQVLGEPYEAQGQALLITDLNSCKKHYEMKEKHDIGTYAGADVGEVIHVIISERDGLKNKYIFIGTVKDFFGSHDSLEYLMDRFKIKFMIIDAKPDSRKVRDLIDKYPTRVVAAYYPTRKFDIQHYYEYNDALHEVYIDRTISMDYLVSEIQNQLIELPINAQYIPEFYQQMTSPIRVTQVNPRTGQSEARWIERGADHYCFIKGTKIQILQGILPIEKVKVGDLVLTRNGYKEVYEAKMTRKKAKVIQVNFSNGGKLIGTPDHKIWIKGKGFVELHSVNYNDKIIICNLQKVLFFKILFTVDILSRKIVQIVSILLQMVRQEVMGVKDTIRNYGNQFMEKFQKVMQSITETVIPLIMISPIWNVFYDQNISQNMLKSPLKIPNGGEKIKNICTKSINYHIYGDERKKEKNGIANMLTNLLFYKNPINIFVLNAVKKLKLWLLMVVNSVQTNVTIVSKQENGGEESVWNLAVKDCHEYYANGILVSNCHATNYNRLALLKEEVAQALLESYNEVNNSDLDSTNLYGISRWIKLKGQRIF